ncbi:hypothetical protein GBA52_027333 [Prunus armeniaca]|nr:hypothetical protein GBA52_027333 [Prunus armeniaca]
MREKIWLVQCNAISSSMNLVILLPKIEQVPSCNPSVIDKHSPSSRLEDRLFVSAPVSAG